MPTVASQLRASGLRVRRPAKPTPIRGAVIPAFPRPYVLLGPDVAPGLERSHVVAHELAHARRGDVFVRALGGSVFAGLLAIDAAIIGTRFGFGEALLWNVAWSLGSTVVSYAIYDRIATRLFVAQEKACDAIASQASGSSYSTVLERRIESMGSARCRFPFERDDALSEYAAPDYAR